MRLIANKETIVMRDERVSYFTDRFVIIMLHHIMPQDAAACDDPVPDVSGGQRLKYPLAVDIERWVQNNWKTETGMHAIFTLNDKALVTTQKFRE